MALSAGLYLPTLTLERYNNLKPPPISDFIFYKIPVSGNFNLSHQRYSHCSSFHCNILKVRIFKIFLLLDVSKTKKESRKFIKKIEYQNH